VFLSYFPVRKDEFRATGAAVAATQNLATAALLMASRVVVIAAVDDGSGGGGGGGSGSGGGGVGGGGFFQQLGWSQVAMVVGGFGGLQLGNRLSHRLSQRQFDHCITALLAVGALLMLLSGEGGWAGAARQGFAVAAAAGASAWGLQVLSHRLLRSRAAAAAGASRSPAAFSGPGGVAREVEVGVESL
jgi:hypothetical protein